MLHSKINDKRLRVLESYVKEVGHDIASSVQSTISKLRNISRGKLDFELSKIKAKEAEEEILSIYRVAENLGFVVDPNYNIKDGGDFNLYESISDVIKQFKSEADERHIEIVLRSSNLLLNVWGDDKAIESAVSQYLINAVKYAHGSSTININIEEDDNNVTVIVINRGIPVHAAEVAKIWEFGFRGSNALDRHVNGSGIGLFTVKKIVTAHGGSVNIRVGGESRSITTFSFSIPKNNILAKTKLLIKETSNY